MNIAVRRIDRDDFLNWLKDQDRKHELVDGVPIMMTGATECHDLIFVNILALLRARLRGRKF